MERHENGQPRRAWRRLKTLAFILGAGLVLWLGLSIFAYWPMAEQPVAGLAGPLDRFVTVQGLNLRWQEQGPADAPVLVLLHGFAGNLGTWDKLAPLLSERLRVIRLDLVGFGLSDKPAPWDYGYAHQAELVAGFLEALDLREVCLAGHSMGGNIAVRAGLASPRVSRLALLDPGILSDGVPAFIAAAPLPFPRLSARLFADPGFRRSGLKGVFHDPSLVSDAMVERYLLAARTPGYAAAMEAMLASYHAPDERSLLKGLDKPVLLLWGREDKHNPPANGELLVPEFSDVRLEIIEQAGHYIQEEQPGRVAEALLGFLD